MKIKAIVLHHTATGTGQSGDGADIVDALSRWAIDQSKGKYHHFYHTLIGPTGRRFNALSWDKVAPHCGIDRGDPHVDPSGVNNQNSIAIACIGNFELYSMPEAQFQTLLQVCRETKKQYSGILFKLHRELVKTLCPGKRFPYQDLFQKLSQLKPHITDLSEKSWYEKAVRYCVEKGLMKVDENQCFRPDHNVTRSELAQVIYNLLQR